MGVKRSEAEVLGHDTTLHAAIDELTHGRRGADPLHDDVDRDQPKPEPAHDREKLYRYGEHTVPPDVFKAMAAVDLRAVDEQGASPRKSADSPPQQLPTRKRWPVLLVLAALIVVGAAAWSLGSTRGRVDAPRPAATSASPALSSAPITATRSASPVRTAPPSAETPPPAPTPSAVASESTPVPAAPPAPSPKRTTSPRPPAQPSAPPTATTTEPSDPDYDPNRPFF